MTFWKPRDNSETLIERAYFEADYLIEKGVKDREEFARITRTLPEGLARDILVFYISENAGFEPDAPDETVKHEPYGRVSAWGSA